MNYILEYYGLIENGEIIVSERVRIIMYHEV